MIKIVRRRREFRDQEMAELLEWAADQLVIADPKSILRLLKTTGHVRFEIPEKLLSVYDRYLAEDGHARENLVRAWHDALEPEEMVFLPHEDGPPPWRRWEVRS